MSVVAAKVCKNCIKIASDSILLNYDTKRNDTFSKLIKINTMIIGTCGSAEEASLMWHFARNHKPESAEERDILAFMIEFSQWKNKFNNSNISNDYLLIYQNHLFEINNLFVHEIHNYTAIGAGMDYALAALYLGQEPKSAVETACHLCCYVCEPIIEYISKEETN